MPSVIGAICFSITESMNIIFIGRLNDASLVAGMGVGRVFLVVFGMITLSGFNTALLTLASQSYGQKDFYLCGVYLN